MLRALGRLGSVAVPFAASVLLPSAASFVNCAGTDVDDPVTGTDADMLMDGLEDDSGAEVLSNPGEFKDLEMQKSFPVEPIEGFNAMVTSVIKGDSSSSFLVQHNVSMAAGPHSSYNVTVSSDSQHEALNAVMQQTPDGLMLQTIVRKPVTDYLALQGHALLQAGAISAGRVEARVTGEDFLAVAFMSLGQRLGGTGVGLNYFQAVTPRLALGADTSFTTNNLEYITTVAYSLYGAYQTADTCVMGRYDRTKNEVMARYWHRASEKVKVGTAIFVDLEKLESKLEFAYELPIRIEEGGFPYTILKGKLYSDLRFVSQVDHTLLNGQGVASLHTSMDHFKQDYKVGVSLRLQA